MIVKVPPLADGFVYKSCKNALSRLDNLFLYGTMMKQAINLVMIQWF